MKIIANEKSLFIWSTFLFLASALILRFLYTLGSAAIHEVFDIEYTYHIFGIGYTYLAFGKWSEAKIFLVFVIIPLLFSLIGWVLLELLKALPTKNLKIRLFLTWASFQFILFFPMQVVSGVFLYDELGVAFTWLFRALWLRAVFAAALLTVFVITRPYWLMLFLKTAFSKEILHNPHFTRKYIWLVLYLPSVAGVVLASIFAVSVPSLTWIVNLSTMLLITLPILNPFFPLMRPAIVKTEDTYAISLSQVLWITLGILFLYLVSFLVF